MPPRRFFPKPRPSDLITVPCCRKCNQLHGLNDELVGTGLLMRDDIKDYPGVDVLVDKVMRSFDRVQGRRIQQLYRESIEEVDLYTESGVYAGRGDIHKISKEGLFGFVERLLRGLFYHEFKKRVPEAFRVVPSLSLERDREMQLGFASLVGSGTVKSVGGRIFSYRWCEAVDSPMTSAWLMCLYERMLFGGLIVGPAADA